jgi:hypothetical protein
MTFGVSDDWRPRLGTTWRWRRHRSQDVLLGVGDLAAAILTANQVDFAIGSNFIARPPARLGVQVAEDSASQYAIEVRDMCP